MKVSMEVSSWCGSFWMRDFYVVNLQNEDILFEISRNDTMFIKNLGELLVDFVKFSDGRVTIGCTYTGGYVGGENKLAEAPWL